MTRLDLGLGRRAAKPILSRSASPPWIVPAAIVATPGLRDHCRDPAESLFHTAWSAALLCYDLSNARKHGRRYRGRSRALAVNFLRFCPGCWHRPGLREIVRAIGSPGLRSGSLGPSAQGFARTCRRRPIWALCQILSIPVDSDQQILPRVRIDAPIYRQGSGSDGVQGHERASG